jgi:hypothetical protein
VVEGKRAHHRDECVERERGSADSVKHSEDESESNVGSDAHALQDELDSVQIED